MRFAQYRICLMAAMLSASVSADEPADTVRTAGRGDLEKVSNFLLFSSSKKFPVQVPSQVSAGDSLSLQYSVDGKSIREQFTVVDISIRGDLCWLHSKKRYQGDASLVDTIYVKPCGRIR
jgi:hypothetical protein